MGFAEAGLSSTLEGGILRPTSAVFPFPSWGPRMDQAAGGPGRGGEAVQTLDLLKRVRAGDRQALESLCERYLPRLRRWVSGHLPRWARDLADTDDLIQETLLHTIGR